MREKELKTVTIKYDVQTGYLEIDGERERWQKGSG